MTQRPPTVLDPATERALAADLFNHTWRLLELANRTPAQNDEMVHAAHASRHHWGRVGGATHIATGEWQCARVYAVLGRPEPALHHARRCLQACETYGLADFHIAAAYEGMARAHAAAGDLAAAREWKARASAALQGIAEDDDREIVASDIASLP